MNLKILLWLLPVMTGIFSCTTQKSSTVWVSGVQVKCFTGAGDKPCLQIYRGESLQSAKWEIIYANIDGLEFEKGVYKQIILNEEKLDLKTLPADAPNVAYTAVKKLDEKVDDRIRLIGKWELNQVSQELIPKDVPTPTLEIDLYEMSLSGSGGCNAYSADIINVTDNQIEWTPITSSTRACEAKNIETQYLEKLYKAVKYKVSENSLFFYNSEGQQLVSFLRAKGQPQKERLHDIWVTKRWMGNTLKKDKSTPVIEINLTRMDMMVRNDCQEYMGALEAVSDTRLESGMIVLLQEEEECNNDLQKMIVSFQEVYTYELNGLELKLIDKTGKEIFAFQKVD